MNNYVYQSVGGISTQDIAVIQNDIQTREGNIRHTHSAIIEEKRRINSLLPISRLSTTILSYMFTYLCLDYSRFPEIEEDPYQCMMVSQVCHCWRTVALAVHSLWSTIYLIHPDYVALLLQRSGSTLLDVVVTNVVHLRMLLDRSAMFAKQTSRGPSIHKSLQLLLKQPHRIRSLRMKVSNHAIADTLKQVHQDSFTAPFLQKVVLRDEIGDDLPDIFHHRHFPTLSHLELHFLRHPTVLRLTTLETLIIHNAEGGKRGSRGLPQRCVLRDLLHVLSNNPRIRVFKLVDVKCGERNLQGDVGAGEPLRVNLSHLQEVKIHSDAACIGLFLTQFILPPSTTVELISSDCSIKVPSPSTYETKILTILRSIVTFIASKSDDMSGLEIAFHGLQRFAGQGPPPSHRYSESCAVTLVTCYGNSPLDLGTDFARRDRFKFHCPGREGWERILSELVFLLPLSSVGYLKLASCSHAIQTCSEMFGHWIANLIGRCSPHGVHTLHISGPMLFLTPFILKSMEQYPDSYGATHHRPTQTTLFYSLHHLILSDITDTDIIEEGPGGDITRSYDLGDVLDALQDQAIRCRGACGRFSTLVLDQCRFREGVLFELVDSVAEIVSQRGRFTNVPPTIYYPPPSPTRTIEPETLPDADLDFSDSEDFFTVNRPEPQIIYWDT